MIDADDLTLTIPPINNQSTIVLQTHVPSSLSKNSYSLIFIPVLGPDSTKDSSARGYKDSANIPCKDKGFTTDLSLLELENRELRMKIRRLEKELADKVS